MFLRYLPADKRENSIEISILASISLPTNYSKLAEFVKNLKKGPMKYPEVTIKLPDWVYDFPGNREKTFTSLENRMKFVVELSRLNITNQTGGPFAAAIFEINEGILVSLGLNMVTSMNSSIMHAEIVAIAIAQQLIGNYDLGNDPSRVYELHTSTEPCAMCLGAIPWSGIRRVVCGARGEDAEQIGFDEGHKPDKGILSLEEQGITVVRDLLRDDAITVLKQYQQSGGQIY